VCRGHSGGVAGREKSAVITVAVLLLPVLSILLYGLDQVEDRWFVRSPEARKAKPHRHRRMRVGRH
jgi:hypothetical protein